MYTQCSKCETVFKLSAEVLRAAGGQVRCGKCGEVFNALARLAEDSSTFESGESPLDLETRADSILESVVESTIATSTATDNDDLAPPGVEIAHLQFLDLDDETETQPQPVAAPPTPPKKPPVEVDFKAVEKESEELVGERSLEFTLPPGELDRIFVESKKRGPNRKPPPPPEVTQEITPHPQSEAVPDRRMRTASGMEVSDDVRREMLEGLDEEAQSPQTMLKSERRTGERRNSSSPEGRRGFFLWLSAAIVAALFLVGQVVSRDHAADFRALIASLGAPAPAPANLSAYQLRQWGVTGDPNANGTLRVRASILNTAAQLQPYPLLRVTLANRFGSRIGARDFEPSEYLGKPTARLLAPGERADATLDILDPGKSAEGFEIDVCLRQGEGKIACASDAAPQTKR